MGLQRQGQQRRGHSSAQRQIPQRGQGMGSSKLHVHGSSPRPLSAARTLFLMTTPISGAVTSHGPCAGR